jgi:hypothetical protein
MASMVIVLRISSVTELQKSLQSPMKRASLSLHGPRAQSCVYAGFIEMLKLPFKFDRS